MLFEARSHYHHEGVTINRLFVSSPRDCFFLLVACPSLGSPAPPYYVEGAGYMCCPIRIRTSLPSNTNRIQVRVLTPYKVNIPYAFPC